MQLTDTNRPMAWTAFANHSSIHFSLFFYLNKAIVSVFNSEGPPVPIPNTEVKLVCAQNTWLEAARENRAVPTQTKIRSRKWTDFRLLLFNLQCTHRSGQIIKM